MRIPISSLLLSGAVLIGAVFSGCGRSSSRTPAIEPPSSRELPSEAPENAADPALPEAIPRAGEPIPAPPGGVDEGSLRYGYRVQVAAFTEEETAAERVATLRRLFDEPVYIVTEGLLFKIQIGDFVSLDRAQEVRLKAVDLGFEGAFVVDSMIRKN